MPAQATAMRQQHVGNTSADTNPARVAEGEQVIAWFLDALPRELGRRVDTQHELALCRRQHGQGRVAVVLQEGMQLPFLDLGVFWRYGHRGRGAQSFGDEAYGCDAGEVDGDCLFADAGAVAREGVLVGVSAAVVGLAFLTGYAGDGGKEDEEVHVGGEMVVKIP